MGIKNDKTLKSSKALAKSVYGVQTRLNQAEKDAADKKFKLDKQSIDDKLKTDTVKAKKEHTIDEGYEKRRDSGLIDRKVWRCGDQISLYDNTDAHGTENTWTVYYEQDQDKKRDVMFEHMAYFEFKDLETATMVFKAMCKSLNIIFSPCTVNSIVGHEYKVVKI